MSDMKVINFMGLRKASTVFSALLILVSIGSFIVNGMHFGLDFTGGTQIQVSYTQAPDLEEIRSVISDAGYSNFEVVNFRTDQDVQIRIQETGEPQEGADQGQQGDASRVADEV
ncbi:MAG: protein translocase subunit SecF, partial [Gammaproteobacteria bacterium]